MSYRWVEHTAEVELHITAPSEEEVFEDALAALHELIVADADGPDKSYSPASEAVRREPTDSAGGEAAGHVDERDVGHVDEEDVVSREVEVSAHDRGALLAAWLDELVFLAETEDLVPEGLERLDLGDERLTATVRAHRGRTRHLVKGVTYHGLRFEAADGQLRAAVVLDV